VPNRFDPYAFVNEHGVVLASARGPVPSLAEAIAGEPIRGSWWSHPRGKRIFAALSELGDRDDIKSFKLIGGHVTLVHRRLWPALVTLAPELGSDRLAEIRQEHTASGAHRNVVRPFPTWVTGDVRGEAAQLDDTTARSLLGPWCEPRVR
jgi:hypothetical protein